jgi:signal transduction histidine kinase
MKRIQEKRINEIRLLGNALAHEIGTPLATLTTAVSMLKEGYENINLIPTIEKSARRSQEILNRISYNINQGNDLDLEEVSIKEFMNNIIQNLSLSAKEKKQIIINIENDFNIIRKRNTVGCYTAFRTAVFHLLDQSLL